jgi:small conductance mechanosensitive channel
MIFSNCEYGKSAVELRNSWAIIDRLRQSLLVWLILCAAAFVAFAPGALAQEKEDPATAQAVAAIELPGSKISDAEFALRLVHLTKPELQETAKGWLKITQAQTKHAADINIALASADGPTAERLRADLGKAAIQRQILFEKLELILKEWEAKGAKPENVAEYRNYVNAVVRSELKATDAKTLSKWFLSWLTSADGGVKIGLSILSLIASLFFVVFLAKVFTGFVKRALHKIPDMSNLLREFVSKIAYWIITAIGIVIALSLFGIDMTPLLAVFGGASFIIGFAMQSTLSNLASGLLLMITKPFDVGDVIDAAGVAGTVQNVSIVSTTILTFDNQVIVVPNTKVWDSVITNVNASDIRRVDLTFGIGYDDDIDLARQTLATLVSSHPLVLDDPAPVIRVHELADSSVNIICRPWAKSDDYWDVYWDLLQQAKERFDAVGLSIPFPQRDVHVYRTGEDASGLPAK